MYSKYNTIFNKINVHKPYIHVQIFLLSLVILVLIVLFHSCSGKKSFENKTLHNVIVLHSWDDVGEEGEHFKNLMKKEFDKAELNVNIKHIYVDMLHCVEGKLSPAKSSNLLKEIQKFKPEVILINDDPMVNWVLQRSPADSIFVNTPCVFAGVNSLLRDSLHNYPLMKGLEDKIDFSRNLELFMRMTDCQSPVIALGYNDNDTRLRNQLYDVLLDSTKFINNADFHVKELNNDSIRKNYPGIVVVNMYSTSAPYLNKAENESVEDAKNRTSQILAEGRDQWMIQVVYNIFSNTLIDGTSHPQLTCIREQFNSSKRIRFVGGYFTTTETQIKDQVNYAVSILNGQSAESLPITVHEPSYCFDWNALQMYNEFPDVEHMYPDAKIVNAPFSKEHTILLWLFCIGGVILILSLIFTIVHFLTKWKQKGMISLIDDSKYEEKIHDLVFSNRKDALWHLKDDVITFNEKFAQFINLPSNAITMDEFAEIINTDTIVSYNYFRDYRHQSGRKTVRLKLHDVKKDKWYWYEMIYTANRDSSLTGEIYGLMLNIDIVKEKEEKIEHAQILASQVALKENFLANISHDLRTPLGAVTGFSTLLTDGDMKFEEGEREMYADIIHQNTEMILNMIDSVMEKAQIETGELEIIQKEVSLSDMITDTYNTNRIIAPSHLKFELLQDEPDCYVNIDSTRIKQVINNFLSNAFKFTAQGTVVLGWKNLNDGKTVEVFVSDTGIGIEQNKLAELFERYVKMDETDHGTGLGLNISKTIVEKQGGTIGAESELGKGSKFFFRIEKCIKSIFCIFMLLTATLNFSSCSSKTQQHRKKANVLVIHGYYNDKSYTEFNNKISSTFFQGGVNANIKHAYLDLGKPDKNSGDILEHLKKSLDNENWKPDVILTEGDRTAHCMLEYATTSEEVYFDDVPVIMGGLHHPEWDLLRNFKNVVPIEDFIDYNTNINLAVELSGRNCVEIELDYFYQDSIIRNELRQAIARPPYIDNTDFHLENITDEKFNTIWKDSIVVLSISTESPEKNTSASYTIEEGYKNLGVIYTYSYLYPSVAVKQDIYSSSIVDKTGMPQFTAVKAGFADGSGRYLAGFFANYETVARDLAEAAIRIIYGTDPTEIIGLTHEKKYYMDYKAMELLGLDYDDYKERFTIVGAPIKYTMPLVYYGTYFIIVLIVLAGMFAFFIIIKSWKSRSVQIMLDKVRQRTQLRDMALHGANCIPVRSESQLHKIINTIHNDYSSDKQLMMQSVEIEGDHSYNIYADIKENGEYRWWMLRFVVMFTSHHNKRIDGILIDNNEIMQHEKDLKLAMQLAEEAKQKEDFLTTISHEIRTPLNAVVGFSDIIVTLPVDTFSKEELKEYGKYIKSNNATLTSMIEDILMFSRIESGRLVYINNTFPAIELLEELAHEWKDILPDDLSLDVVCMKTNMYVNSDRTRIKYIMNQFVSNAVKNTKSGNIIIGAAYHLNDDIVEFFVEDTGCGISQEKQQAVFNLFWKNDEFIPGLGLGLHVVKKLSEGLNLTLCVESKVGIGSKFSISLPGSIGDTKNIDTSA